MASSAFTLQAQTISTFAGSMAKGAGYNGDGGQANAAQLNKPSSIALDKAGNVYITDFQNNVVRKVNAEGVITTIAGNGTEGYSGDGYKATAAQLHGPWGIAVDEAGNVYFSDKENHAIRKVNTAGIITTIAGKGKAGYSGDKGLATAAMLDHPLGLAIDKAGNIYIADNSNTAVRKINTAGIITTFAGSFSTGYSGDGGLATNAKFKNIRYVACDGIGNVYISDTWNSVIRKVDAAGYISTVAGNHTSKYSGDGGAATNAGIYFPVGITATDDGTLFIADNHNHVIRKVDKDGIITTVAGNGTKGYSGDNGPATTAQLTNPTSIVAAPDGRLLIAEFAHNIIRQVNVPAQVKSMSEADGTRLNVYPNPSHGAFSVQLPEYKTPASISVADITGRVIETRMMEKNSTQVVSFNLINVAAGNYIVKVVVDGNTNTAKVVIE